MAGAGYKLFQTGDVLTAAQVNTYLNEQTVMVFANAAARTSALTSVLAEGMMSYLQDTNSVEVYNGSSWVNVGNAGDITEVQAGTGISVASGTGPIPVITNTVATAFDAAGDLVYGTGADTFTKLSLGTAGKVLTVNSGATAPEWAAPAGGAGNMAQIATGTLSGASVTISSLSTYDNLLLLVHSSTNNTGNGITKFRINNNSGGNYSEFGPYFDGSSFQNKTSTSDDGIFGSVAAPDRTNNANVYGLKITNAKQAGFTDFSMVSRVYTGNNVAHMFQGIYTQSEAVSSLVILNAGGTWSAGTYILWGS